MARHRGPFFAQRTLQPIPDKRHALKHVDYACDQGGDRMPNRARRDQPLDGNKRQAQHRADGTRGSIHQRSRVERVGRVILAGFGGQRQVCHLGNQVPQVDDSLVVVDHHGAGEHIAPA